MTISAQLEDPAGPLKKFAALLQIDLPRLWGAELPEKLNFNEPHLPLDKIGYGEDVSTNAQKLAGLDEVLSEMWTKYGPALTLRLKIPGEVLTVDAIYKRDKLEEFFKVIHDSPDFELQLVIDKKLLLEQNGFSHSSVTFKLFLFPEALASELNVPLVQLEQDENALLKDFNGESKFMILVPNHDIELNGTYLSVLGRGAVARWRDYLPSKLGLSRDRIKLVCEEARERLKWVHINLEYLTPLQFQVEWPKPEDEGPRNDDLIAGPLYAQSLACSLLYMAGHTSSNQRKVAGSNSNHEEVDHSWTATFAADKFMVKFRVGDTDELKKILVEKSTGNPWKTARLISRRAAWIYEDERNIGNRLIVLQNVIADSLQNYDPSEVLPVLTRRAKELCDRVEWGWEAFIGDKLETYFSQEKELEDIVDSTAKSYNEQVLTLTKTLIDNMLAAVGVIVGSFIAAMFNSPFQEYVFWFGTGIYVAYLLVFPVLVGLTSTWQRFADSKTSFAKRKNDFRRQLSKHQVDQIVGDTVTEKESWFERWFKWTIGLYVAVLVLVVAAMFAVPGMIKSWSDDFELTGVSYDGPPNSDTVAMTIRGANFNKDKEIVVMLGDESFRDTDGGTLKVHGSTVLTLSPLQEQLAKVTASGNRSISVQQGSAGPKQLSLPNVQPPIPEPEFETWTVSAPPENGLVCQGRNFGSIAAIGVDGVRLKFAVSNEGRKIELSNPGATKKLKAGQVLKLVLKNGNVMPDLTVPKITS